MAAGTGLVLEGCAKRYGPTHALDDVSLDVPSGSVTGLVGANGAGKTTLLHAVVGLIRVDAGVMTLDGVPVHDVRAKRRMSFMPDDLPRPLRLTGRELIELTCRLYGRWPADIDTTARRLELGGRLDEPLSSFSHGMRRKVDLMAALAVEPDLLVLDEPFSGLDPGMVLLLQETIRTLCRAGTAVLVSSHDLELVEALADQIVVLDCGRVVARGGSEELARRFGSGDLRSAFLSIIGDEESLTDDEESPCPTQ